MVGLEERATLHHGRRVRYLVVGGEGPALVLCHGFLGSAENFETWFDELAPRRTLIVPDLPGFGASEPLAGPHTAEALSRAVETVAAAEGLARFDLGGLCLGASVAQDLVRRRPDAVGRLILHTPLVSPVLVRRHFHVQVAVMTAPGVFPAIAWLSRRRLVSDLYKRFVVEGKDVDPRAALVNFENQCRAVPRASREWLRDGLRREDLSVLADRRGETLVVVAADDRIVDTPALLSLLDPLPGVEVAVIESAGHGWTGDYVRRQLKVLTAFLDRAPRAGAARSPAGLESLPA